MSTSAVPLEHVGWVNTSITALDDRTLSRGEMIISAKIAGLQEMMPAIFLYNEEG